MTATDVTTWVEALGSCDGRDVSDAERIDAITACERLKAAASAAQAKITARFDASQRARAAARGIPAARQGAGIAEQVALARHVSPFQGSRALGLAKVLCAEMPRTLAAMSAGDLSEWRATIVARETAQLSREHREQVDAELAPRLGELGDRELGAEARKIGYRLDPGAIIRRTSRAEKDRTVSLRPAPDTMSYLTAHLTAQVGVQVFTTLKKHAESIKSQGDQRSIGQIMADTLAARVLGTEEAGGAVEVRVTMSDQSLFGDGSDQVDHEPAHLDGFGPIPAFLARRWIRGAAKAWIRRVYLHPFTGDLVAMDSKRQRFDGQLRDALVVADQVCRTPWCDAPIRHADHVVPKQRGGATRFDNGQGLCERCNYAKEAIDWRSTSVDGDRRPVFTTTPTGHTYVSRSPDLPGSGPPPPSEDVDHTAQNDTNQRAPEQEGAFIGL